MISDRPYIILFAARALIASPFIVSGVNKALHFEAAVNEVAGLGLPLPLFFTIATVITQLGASVLLFHRRFSGLGALVLGAFTIAATLLAHAFWTMTGVTRAQNMMIFLEHAAIVGGLLLLANWSFIPKRDER
jgi:transmembrane protein